MQKLDLTFEWEGSGKDSPEIELSMGMFQLTGGETCLTRNVDLWAKTVKEKVLVSAYPLATWLAGNWWRLMHEPLPPQSLKPTANWRMAHEMAAANHGFLWPNIIMATDSEKMQIWAKPSNPDAGQAIKYLNGLAVPVSIDMKDFIRVIDNFIDNVLSRLDATGVKETDLFHLWNATLQERADVESARYRKTEAEMGFEPDECPENIVADSIELAARLGAGNLSELAPVCGKLSAKGPLQEIRELLAARGVKGRPDLLARGFSVAEAPARYQPWHQANERARQTRKMLANPAGAIPTQTICDLLGLKVDDINSWQPLSRQQISIALQKDDGFLDFFPRKKHPTARRFELARFIGDYILSDQNECKISIACTDLRTCRQKFQRAYAAELLCPLNGLLEFLDNDFSESAIEDAANHYEVSLTTVTSILANNGFIPRTELDDLNEGPLPY